MLLNLRVRVNLKNGICLLPDNICADAGCRNGSYGHSNIDTSAAVCNAASMDGYVPERNAALYTPSWLHGRHSQYNSIELSP
jgi:hypothetical protein